MTCFATLVIENVQVTLVEVSVDVYELRFLDMRDGTMRVVPARTPGSADAMALFAAWLMCDGTAEFSLAEERGRLYEALNGTNCFLP